MNLQVLLSAIAPVILILGLGFAAGKHRSFSADQTGGLSRLALQYALPAALFLGMAHFDRHLLLRQGPVVIVMLIGYSVFFLTAYGVLRLLRTNKLQAALFGYTVSSTAAPIYGLTVLVPIFGETVGTGIVGLSALCHEFSTGIHRYLSAAIGGDEAGVVSIRIRDDWPLRHESSCVGSCARGDVRAIGFAALSACVHRAHAPGRFSSGSRNFCKRPDLSGFPY